MAKEYNHRHLREIDCSSAVVGGLAEGAESGGKSIHWTRTWLQKVLHSRCCGWWHNYYSQQRQAGRSNEQSTSLRCLWVQLTNSLTHTRTPLRCTKWKYKQRNISSFNKKICCKNFTLNVVIVHFALFLPRAHVESNFYRLHLCLILSRM